MKKIIALTLLLMLVLTLCGCANGLLEDTPDSSKGECAYCGDLSGGNRWFIAKVIDQYTVMPLGTDCFEAKAAGDAGIRISAASGTLEEGGFAVGDVIRITYGGEIMESYPVQIAPISMERADQFDTQ